MSGLSRDEREQLAEALHDGLDGDYLIGAGRSIGYQGEDVAISDARPKEVVAWAVGQVAPVVAAIADERAQAAVGALHEYARMRRDRLALARESALRRARSANPWHDVARRSALMRVFEYRRAWREWHYAVIGIETAIEETP